MRAPFIKASVGKKTEFFAELIDMYVQSIAVGEVLLTASGRTVGRILH